MSDVVTAQWRLGAGFRLGMRVAGPGGRAAVSCPGAWWSDEGIVGKFSRRFVYKCVFTQCALFSARPPPLARRRGPTRARALTLAAESSSQVLLILRRAAAPGQKRSLLITRGRHSGAAELSLPKTPPHTHPNSRLCSVLRLFPSGDRRGEGREGGALGSLAAPFVLTSLRSESPGAPAVKLLRLGRRAMVSTRPQLWRRRLDWPWARLDPA